jgi:hypothetical protein
LSITGPRSPLAGDPLWAERDLWLYLPATALEGFTVIDLNRLHIGLFDLVLTGVFGGLKATKTLLITV